MLKDIFNRLYYKNQTNRQMHKSLNFNLLIIQIFAKKAKFCIISLQNPLADYYQCKLIYTKYVAEREKQYCFKHSVIFSRELVQIKKILVK